MDRLHHDRVLKVSGVGQCRCRVDRVTRGLFGGSRGGNGVAALLLAVGLLLATGACGTDAQTLRPYTPADGINLDVGNPSDATTVVHVRNLLIISRAPGQGVLSATLMTYGRDELTGVTGTAIKVDSTTGSPFTAALDQHRLLRQRRPDRAHRRVADRGEQSRPGGWAHGQRHPPVPKAGEATLVVPVVDGNDPVLRDHHPGPGPQP